MKAQRSVRRAERAAFEILEPRLLLDGALWPEIGALGTPELGATAAATEEIHVTVQSTGVPDEKDVDIDNDGADGDGKLGLNDVPTTGAPEPTHLTLDGRGIDLNEDEKVDALGGASFRHGYLSVAAYDFEAPGSEAGPGIAEDMAGPDGTLSLMIGVNNGKSDSVGYVGPDMYKYMEADASESELNDPEWIPLYDSVSGSGAYGSWTLHVQDSATTAAFPDVCKTPGAPGPIPVPYPDTGMSSNSGSGPTSVKTDGKTVMPKGSEVNQSVGDEAGTTSDMSVTLSRLPIIIGILSQSGTF